jgi:hypothetical protein
MSIPRSERQCPGGPPSRAAPTSPGAIPSDSPPDIMRPVGMADPFDTELFAALEPRLVSDLLWWAHALGHPRSAT